MDDEEEEVLDEQEEGEQPEKEEVDPKELEAKIRAEFEAEFQGHKAAVGKELASKTARLEALEADPRVRAVLGGAPKEEVREEQISLASLNVFDDDYQQNLAKYLEQRERAIEARVEQRYAPQLQAGSREQALLSTGGEILDRLGVANASENAEFREALRELSSALPRDQWDNKAIVKGIITAAADSAGLLDAPATPAAPVVKEPKAPANRGNLPSRTAGGSSAPPPSRFSEEEIASAESEGMDVQGWALLRDRNYEGYRQHIAKAEKVKV